MSGVRWLPGLAAVVSEADKMTEVKVYFETPEWTALIEWLALHDLDARKIPAGTRISRDQCGRCIRYVALDLDDHGLIQHGSDGRVLTLPAVEQGEALWPLPDLLTQQMYPTPQTGARR